MKKILIYLFLLSLSLLTISCSNGLPTTQVTPLEKGVQQNSKENHIQTVNTHANFKEYHAEKDLFEDADLIVIAETDINFLDREHVADYLKPDEGQTDMPPILASFHTKTPVKVWKVLKQSSSLSVKEGQEMVIIEPVSLIEENSSLKKISTENYNEIHEQEKYVLYLKQNTYGEYGVINMNNGRFNIDEESFEFHSLSKNQDDEQQNHEKLKQDVEQRFKTQIEEVRNQ